MIQNTNITINGAEQRKRRNKKIGKRSNWFLAVIKQLHHHQLRQRNTGDCANIGNKVALHC